MFACIWCGVRRHYYRCGEVVSVTRRELYFVMWHAEWRVNRVDHQLPLTDYDFMVVVEEEEKKEQFEFSGLLKLRG